MLHEWSSARAQNIQALQGPSPTRYNISQRSMLPGSTPGEAPRTLNLKTSRVQTTGYGKRSSWVYRSDPSSRETSRDVNCGSTKEREGLESFTTPFEVRKVTRVRHRNSGKAPGDHPVSHGKTMTWVSYVWPNQVSTTDMVVRQANSRPSTIKQAYVKREQGDCQRRNASSTLRRARSAKDSLSGELHHRSPSPSPASRCLWACHAAREPRTAPTVSARLAVVRDPPPTRRTSRDTCLPGLARTRPAPGVLPITHGRAVGPRLGGRG